MRIQLGAHAGKVVEQFPAAADKQGAHVRELDAIAGSPQNLVIQAVFELGDLLRYRGSRDVQVNCNARQLPQLRDGNDKVQLGELEPGIEKAFDGGWLWFRDPRPSLPGVTWIS